MAILGGVCVWRSIRHKEGWDVHPLLHPGGSMSLSRSWFVFAAVTVVCGSSTSRKHCQRPCQYDRSGQAQICYLYPPRWVSAGRLSLMEYFSFDNTPFLHELEKSAASTSLTTSGRPLPIDGSGRPDHDADAAAGPAPGRGDGPELTMQHYGDCWQPTERRACPCRLPRRRAIRRTRSHPRLPAVDWRYG